MSPEDIRLVRTSYDEVVPIATEAAALFYRRLFEVAPAVRRLFRGDMDIQGRMLMATIGLVVRNLEQPDRVLGMIDKLGARHQDYGARPEHYPVVGETLLWTLQQGLGPRFTPAHRQAWQQAYALLSGLMIDAQARSGRHAA